MSQSALYALIAFGLSLALVPLCRRIAIRLGYVARPRADRWHGRPTALFGGVAIALVTLALYGAIAGVRTEPVLLVGAGLMFAVGFVDDLVSLTPSTKLVFEIAVASLFVFFGYRLAWVRSLTLDTMLTVLWIVGLTNAFNLLDNMDGLAAGLCLIAGTSVLGSLGSGGAGTEATYVALLLGATAGFLVYNFHPASIFMGDSGSLFIGFSLAVLTLNSPSDTHTSSSLLSVMAGPALILLVPILDTTLVTASRLLSGRSAAQGGRDHSSHRLVAIGLSERGAVLVLWALAALGGLLALAIDHYHNDWPTIVAALFVLGMAIFAVYLAHVRVYDDEGTGPPVGGRVTPVVVNFVYRRRISEVMLDLCLIAIAYYSSYRLRFSGAEFAQFFPGFLQSLPLVVGVQILSLFAVGGYRGIWRFFGLMDGVTFARGVGLGTLINVALILFVYRFEAYSRGVFVIYAALLMLLLSGSRASFRLIGEFAHRRSQSGARVLIYGVGDIAASAVRDALANRPGGYRMLGFIADDPGMQGTRMQGYAVVGDYATLADYIASGRVDLVVITQPIDPDRLAELCVLCTDKQVGLERLHFSLDQLVAVP